MRIEILSEAEDDLVAGAKFYERKRAGLGEYFLNSLYSDIDSLLLYVGNGSGRLERKSTISGRYEQQMTDSRYRDS